MKKLKLNISKIVILQRKVNINNMLFTEKFLLNNNKNIKSFRLSIGRRNKNNNFKNLLPFNQLLFFLHTQ